MGRLELPTPSTPYWCASQLRHTPIINPPTTSQPANYTLALKKTPEYYNVIRMSDTTSVIQKRLKILDDLLKELNKLKDDLDGALQDDPNYGKFLEEREETKKDHKEKKGRIMATGVVKGYQVEIKEKIQEIKENREILSQELVDYYRENGTLEIVDANGNVKRMKFSVKLVN